MLCLLLLGSLVCTSLEVRLKYDVVIYDFLNGEVFLLLDMILQKFDSGFQLHLVDFLFS